MWKKVYFGLVGIGAVVLVFFAYYAWSWLQSIGEPRTAWEAFNYHKRTGVYFLCGWTILLLVTGNVILWMRRMAWALWATDAFFVIGAAVFLIWLHAAGVTFCLDNGVSDSPSRAVGPLLAFIGAVVLTIFIFANQFLVLRLHEKMYGRPTAEETSPNEPDDAEDRPLDH